VHYEFAFACMVSSLSLAFLFIHLFALFYISFFAPFSAFPPPAAQFLWELSFTSFPTFFVIIPTLGMGISIGSLNIGVLWCFEYPNWYWIFSLSCYI